MDKLPRVQIHNPFVGIAHMQVCVEKDATDEEILRVCNEQNYSGTTGGWSTVIRENYEDDFWPAEKMRPVQCQQYLHRVHLLVAC